MKPQTTAITLPDGTVGFDTVTPIDVASSAEFAGMGYGFVIRYIGRDDGSTNYTDLTTDELQIITNSDLALGVVQHPLAAGWRPSVRLGRNHGSAAVRLACAAAVPPGVTVWLDLEGVSSEVSAPEVLGHCNAWWLQVAMAGFLPGLYVGANPGVSADQLYWDLRFQAYWRGGSSAAAGVPDSIPKRGYQMEQRITDPGTATEFDSNVCRADQFGGTVRWCG